MFASTVYSKALAGDPGLLQLFFDAEVIERYRQRADYTVKRTDSAGRVKQEGGWVLDYGIADEGRVIHAPFRDVAARVPPSEREHWLEHMVTLPLSPYFMQVLLSPGSCLNDGEIRDG